MLRELARSYLNLVKDQTRVMNRLKAMYRSWAIPCAGRDVYYARHRAEWLGKIREAGVRRRAEHLYQQLDMLQHLRQQARRELLAESRKHSITAKLRQIPWLGPIRAALTVALIQTPPRFRTPRQLWAYSGLALETRTSGEHCYVQGQLRRSKKQVSIRGLNKDHNHDLKGLFKAAATRASVQPGPFQDFYQASLAKGIKPTMVRLTLARKIAAITLTLWKKGENFDAEKLKSQAACASRVKSPSISGDLFLVVASWFLRRSGSRVSILMACRRTVPVALSLCVNPMPSRTTRKSNRPRASDRTMVDTVQPQRLPVSETDRRRRY